MGSGKGWGRWRVQGGLSLRWLYLASQLVLNAAFPGAVLEFRPNFAPNSIERIESKMAVVDRSSGPSTP